MKKDIEELARFLDKANKHTYAADGEKVIPSRPGSEDFEYIDGKWKYYDTYFGNEKFIGEEIVYKNDVPFWGMNYYGYTIKELIPVSEIYKFLKKSLLQNYADIIPVRGPKKYKENYLEYENSANGSLENFGGKEQINKNDEILYEAVYHGGLIQGKE